MMSGIPLIYSMCIMGNIRYICGMLWILYDVLYTFKIYYVYYNIFYVYHNIYCVHLIYVMFILGYQRYI